MGDTIGIIHGDLGLSRKLTRHRRETMATCWPRAAALLCRRALELTLGMLWVHVAPGLGEATTRTQLSCLPVYLGDEWLAREVRHAWAQLSHACHHHPYELGPSAEELDAWIDVVSRFAQTVGSLNGDAEPRR